MVHDYGPGRRYASLHVELDSREDPMACHELIDDMERGCLKELGIHLVIHYDPLITDDAELNRLQQLVETLLKVRDPSISIHDFRLRHQEDRASTSSCPPSSGARRTASGPRWSKPWTNWRASPITWT